MSATEANSFKKGRIFSVSVVLSLAASAFFFWVFYEHYLSVEFNELGRYYDAENQVVYTDSAVAWCLPAFGFLCAAVADISCRLWFRQRSRK